MIGGCFEDESGICVKNTETLNAKKKPSMTSSLQIKFGFLRPLSCLWKKLQLIFERNAYKTKRLYLSCRRLTGKLVTCQIIHSCNFLEWVQRHIRWVWRDRGKYFGERYSSWNTHGDTKQAL